MELQVTVDVDMKDLLSAVWDNLNGSVSPWIESYEWDWKANDGSQSVTVLYEDPDAEVTGRKFTTVTPEMLGEAFSKMVGFDQQLHS